MSRAALSMLVFGIYMALEGAALLVAPQVLTGMFGLPAPADVWARIVGIALLVFALYYVMTARAEVTPFFRFTVVGRTFQFLLFVGLVALGGFPAILLGASAVELASGLWTWWALRADARGAPLAARPA